MTDLALVLTGSGRTSRLGFPAGPDLQSRLDDLRAICTGAEIAIALTPEVVAVLGSIPATAEIVAALVKASAA